MAARCERGPDDAVGVDVHTAGIEARLGNLVDLGDARLRRVLAAIDANEITGIALGDAPDRVVHRARDHAVEAIAHEGVELGIGTASLRASACTAGASTAAGRIARVEQ